MDERLYKATVLCLIIFSAFIFVNYLAFSLLSVSYPYDLIADEGNLAIASYNFFEGNLQKLYNGLSKPPKYYYNDYPPLFYAISAIPMLWLGKSLVAGRAISFIFSILSGMLIFLITRKLTENRLFSALSSLLFFCSNVIFYWGSVFRPDMVALTFSLGGIFFLLDWKDERKFYSAILFFVLAVYTKQTFFLAFLASFIYLFFKSRKKSVKFFTYFACISFGIFLVLNFLTNFQFYQHVFTGNLSMQYTIRDFVYRFLGNYLIPISLSLYYLIKNRKATEIVPLFFIFTFVFGIFQTFKAGGWHQYFIPLLSAVSILPVLELHKKYRSKDFLKFGLIAALLFIHLVLLTFQNPQLRNMVIDPENCPPLANFEADKKVKSYVKNHQNILIENRGFLLRNNKKITPEMWGTVEAVRSERLSENEVYQYYLRNNITLVAYHHQGLFQHFKPLQKYLKEYCRPKENIKFLRRHNVKDEWKIYTCKAR